MKLIEWVISCAVGVLIGTAFINTVGFEGAMAVTGVLITALLVVLCIRMGM